jgi:hypothetical protein
MRRTVQKCCLPVAAISVVAALGVRQQMQQQACAEAADEGAKSRLIFLGTGCSMGVPRPLCLTTRHPEYEQQCAASWVAMEAHPPTHLHTYTHTQTHTYTHIHICTHTHTHIHIHVYIYTHTHIHTHRHTHTHTHTHINMHTHTHTNTHTDTHFDMHAG